MKKKDEKDEKNFRKADEEGGIVNYIAADYVVFCCVMKRIGTGN